VVITHPPDVCGIQPVGGSSGISTAGSPINAMAISRPVPPGVPLRRVEEHPDLDARVRRIQVPAPGRHFGAPAGGTSGALGRVTVAGQSRVAT
jgi:hypothetical protein